MPAILIAGSGHIGAAVAQLLAAADPHYTVLLIDTNDQPPPIPKHTHLHYFNMDIQDKNRMTLLAHQYQITAVVSCLPFFLNLSIAEWAKSLRLHYFDLTEDIETSKNIARIAEEADTAFVSHCGVAPGFINIVAHHMMQRFKKLDAVKLRCGALPQQTNNVLQYALTWSIDGLINEYGNPCAAISQGKFVWLPPLSELEVVRLDGSSYEAFHTSGGLGTLAEQYAGQVNTLNYKTLRYPGHCEKMQFLMKDLKLNDDRKTLKKILTSSLPHTTQDLVIVEVTVQGHRDGELVEEGYFNKFYPVKLNHHYFTAIQITTASAVCACVDLVIRNPEKYRGFVHQSQFPLTDFLNGPFGKYLQGKRT